MKKKILIIDDDLSLQRVIEYKLSEEGYETRVASSGEEGLNIFKEDRFDLVISDMRMKKIDGIAVLKKVKKRSPLEDRLL